MGTLEMTYTAISLERAWFPWNSQVSGPRSLAELDQPSKANVEPPPSVFGQRDEPMWLRSVSHQIRNLAKLKQGWDHHGGRPIGRDTLFFTWQFLNDTLESNTPTPRIVPLSYGGVQVEWHEKGIDLEVEIEAPFRVHVWFRDHQTGLELEEELGQDFGRLEEPIHILSTR